MRRFPIGKILISITVLLLVASLFGYLFLTWNSPNETTSPESLKYPLTIQDQSGNNVTIQKEPMRIVSLIPSNTEIAFALGLGEKVVAVTTNDNYPKQVRQLPRVGDMTIDMEKVIAQNPDLVLASKRNGNETIDKLKKLGLTVIVLDAESVKEIYRSIDILSQATNTIAKADQLIKQMEQEIRTIATKVSQIPNEKRKKVWFEISPDLYTVGKGTLAHELITLAGGRNAAGQESSYPKISEEQVIGWNPDVILCSYPDPNSSQRPSAWAEVEAVKKGNIHSINPDIVNRPGPRIVEAIKTINLLLYPELNVDE